MPGKIGQDVVVDADVEPLVDRPLQRAAVEITANASRAGLPWQVTDP
ncbi:hypothetical protein [Nonomuraea sp. NPDC049141]